jgi:hypothetical protein
MLATFKPVANVVSGGFHAEEEDEYHMGPYVGEGEGSGEGGGSEGGEGGKGGDAGKGGRSKPRGQAAPLPKKSASLSLQEQEKMREAHRERRAATAIQRKVRSKQTQQLTHCLCSLHCIRALFSLCGVWTVCATGAQQAGPRQV